MATTYNTAIRKQLNTSGIDNSRIGFANGYVTVDGKNFIKPTTSTNGVSYTSSSAFNTALKNVTGTANNASTTGNKLGTASSAAATLAKSVAVPTQSGKTTATTTATQTQPTAAWTPPVSQTQQTLNQIAQQLAKQQQTQFTAPEAFSYNPETDPAYQSQLALAKQNIARQQFDTNAALRASGQGKSSYSETVANQIGTDALSTLANTIVPQLQAQAYQQYNDTANRSLEVAKANYGVGQDYLTGLGNQYQYQNQEYFQNPIDEAQVTGTYQSTAVKDALNQLVALKQQAETKGITKDDRSALSKQADSIRQYLSGQGVDTSTLSAKTASNKINVPGTGVRTIQGQQLDQQAKQNNISNAIAVSDLTGRVVTPQADANGLWRQAASGKAPLTLAAQQQAYNQAYQTDRAKVSDDQWNKTFDYNKTRDTVADNQWSQQFEYNAYRAAIGDQQWQAQFDENVRTHDLDYALSYAIQNGQLSLQQAQDAREQAKFNYDMSTATQGTNAADYASKYIDPIVKYDSNTGAVLNPDQVEGYLTSLEGQLSDYDIYQLYNRYGLGKRWTDPVPTAPKSTSSSSYTGGATKQTSYDPYIESAAKTNGVSTALIKGIIQAESSFNPNAGSSAGAQGLMQLMPATAKGLGVTNIKDPQQNINGGTKFISGLIAKYNGDVQLALAAYNAGPGRVDGKIKKYGASWDKIKAYMPKETQAYVGKVLTNTESFKR